MKTINLVTFKSELRYENNIKERSEAFYKRIEKEGNFSFNVADVKDNVEGVKIIFIESGGSEGLFLENIKYFKEPYYFLTSGENNSLAASLEILTYLNNNNLKGEIIHGSISYIAGRINSLIKDSNRILENQRFGIIGRPSDWLISSIPTYEKVYEKLGATLVDIPLSILEKKSLSFNDISIDNIGFSKEETFKANSIYNALNSIKNEYNLAGLTIRCFDLLTSLKSTGCLGLAILNKDGTIATCEGDIMALLSMAIIKKISGKSSFQANPSRIDIDNRLITFAHCTLPLDMCESVSYNTHFESGIGVAIKGELFLSKVTVFRLSSDFKHFFVGTGNIIRNLNETNLCRTQIEVKMDEDISCLLNSPTGNHHIIVYGDYKKELIELFKRI